MWELAAQAARERPLQLACALSKLMRKCHHPEFITRVAVDASERIRGLPSDPVSLSQAVELKRTASALYLIAAYPLSIREGLEREFPIFDACITPETVKQRGVVIPPCATSRKTSRATLLSVFGLMRPHQWVKNLLVFAPVLAGHTWTEPATILGAALAFVAMSLLASAIYCVNDILDAPEDRSHPQKRFRPVAAGRVSIAGALGVAGMCLAGAGVVSLGLKHEFLPCIGVYTLFAAAYALHFKRRRGWDVALLTSLYAIRVVAGGAATGIGTTPWLFGFAVSLFGGLALLKRFGELRANASVPRLAGRAYTQRDQSWLVALGFCLAALTALIVGGYAISAQAATLYGHAQWLIGAAIAIFVWEALMWWEAHKGRIPADPVLSAIRLPWSYVCAAVALVFATLAK